MTNKDRVSAEWTQEDTDGGVLNMIFLHYVMQLPNTPMNKSIREKKKLNKWKEGGCTWIDRLAGDW